MASNYNEENQKARGRLQKLVNSISDEELKYIIYQEGWTVAAALGHIAFWDERRLVLIRRWERGEYEYSDINGVAMDTVNDALVPLFLSVPVRVMAEMVIASAEKIDKEIAGLSPELMARIEAVNDPFFLNRAKHRNMHLDEIEALFKSKRS
jgi:hypothetical protein